ncbi:hypothetical protein LCGC14_0861070 [marine sediment metagenome]|uniref:Uncharacterized protein n=1 Tax=marine sediment metagenome TaxID=412755 RepID=A0A0F9PST2_9ZZZZ
MILEKHRKMMRERNKERYHNDSKYKEAQKKKGNIRNKAISILINNHKKEFIKISGDLKDET